MKERPIIFSAPMVRAILDGRKSQTRRVCKAAQVDGEDLRDADGWPMRDLSADGAGEVRSACPYGQPGDRLWVRESAWYDRELRGRRFQPVARHPQSCPQVRRTPDRGDRYRRRYHGPAGQERGGTPMKRGLLQGIRDFFVLDGIPDEDLSPGSDWKWLTPQERLGVQSRADAEIACRLIEKRKREEQEARDALLDYINEHGTAGEGVQHHLDRYVRAARVQAKDGS